MSQSPQKKDSPSPPSFKEKLWEIVFEAETPTGKFFDVALLWFIGASVLAVMLESVGTIKQEYGRILYVAEWVFTVVFSIEYFLRVWLVRTPSKYIFSFYGIVDLLSCLPSYFALLFASSPHFAVIRLLRLLRMFRVLKMVAHVRGANTILRGLAAAKAKITVFFFAMLIFAMITGTLIYIVESGVENTKFTSIPISIYYSIISITTVGYGDMTVQTALGQILTSFIVLAGYAIIAVPTGIVAGDMVREAMKPDETTDACPSCGTHGHLMDAVYCRKCGEKFDKEQRSNLGL
ncbi:MAG: ion transporter [Akkermansiaceae bacterium]